LHIKPDCVICLLNQSLRVSRLLELDDETSKQVLDQTAKILLAHDLSYTPPQIAKEIYRSISDITGLEDPVALAKERASAEAMKIDSSFVRNIRDAIKLSVIGNVIDFGAQNEFGLQESIERHFDSSFAIDDSDAFIGALSEAKELVVLGDNTGEHIFDKLLIEMILREYELKVYYFVRGTPIINDVTVKEAELLSDVAEVIDTGVGTPGYDLSEANRRSREIFDRADLVLSKGMGNFESLYLQAEREIYFLFIVKCNVVAEAIGKEVKDMIFKKDP